VLVVCHAESTVRCFFSSSTLVLLFLLYISDTGRRKVRYLPVLVLAIPGIRWKRSCRQGREGGKQGVFGSVPVPVHKPRSGVFLDGQKIFARSLFYKKSSGKVHLNHIVGVKTVFVFTFPYIFACRIAPTTNGLSVLPRKFFSGNRANHSNEVAHFFF
jgi:hypothetical protein